MTYSIEALLFRAAVGVVNTAARAANCALEVMYPSDAARIWDEGRSSSSVAGVAAGDGTAPTDPHLGGVADPEAETPRSVSGSLTWEGWAIPAICEVLAEHQPIWHTPSHDYDCGCGSQFGTLVDWTDHVAPEIAARIGCDPTRAALALTSLQTQ